MEQARRESFYYRGWPVEAFIHDTETLSYFFNDDRKSGFPALPQMVAEAIVVSEENELACDLKEQAHKIIDDGPPALDQIEIDRRRYQITDLIDDIREPRSRAELMGSGSRLLEYLADFYFRSRGKWSSTGKTIFRKLAKDDLKMQKQFEFAFSELFAEANPAPCIDLAEKILSQSGGLLFDGYALDAPKEWRIASADL